MTSVAVNIHHALTKKGDNHSSDSVARLIAEAQAELARVAETVAEDERLLADILTPEDQEAAIKQRLAAALQLQKKLDGAMPRLEALRDQITLRERDAAQKAWYQRLVKRRDVIGKQLAESARKIDGQLKAMQSEKKKKAEGERREAEKAKKELTKQFDESLRNERRKLAASNVALNKDIDRKSVV
jgi:hypothetical protein